MKQQLRSSARRPRARWLATLAAVALLPTTNAPALATPPGAEEPVAAETPALGGPQLEIETWELVVFPTVFLSATAMKLFATRGDVTWTDQPGIDRAAIDAFSTDDDTAKLVWRGVGDSFYIGGIAYSVLSPISIGVRTGDWSRAGAVSFLHVEALAFAGSAVFITQQLVRRARPGATGCRDDDPTTGCSDGGKESFPGGHLTMATTVAALSCFHDTRLDVWGNDVAEAVSCGVMSAGALATFFGRMANDKHHLTDQLLGLSLGLFSGGLLPWLLHPEMAHERPARDADAGGARVLGIAPTFGPERASLSLLGTF